MKNYVNFFIKINNIVIYQSNIKLISIIFLSLLKKTINRETKNLNIIYKDISILHCIILPLSYMQINDVKENKKISVKRDSNELLKQKLNRNNN